MCEKYPTRIPFQIDILGRKVLAGDVRSRAVIRRTPLAEQQAGKMPSPELGVGALWWDGGRRKGGQPCLVRWEEEAVKAEPSTRTPPTFTRLVLRSF